MNETITRIDPDVSDLFFNTDVSEAKRFEDRQFVGFDEAELRDCADMFCRSLYRATGGMLRVSPDDLVADFLRRL